jgi:hypothetical protein
VRIKKNTLAPLKQYIIPKMLKEQILLPSEIDVSKVSYDKKKALAQGEICRAYYDNKNFNVQGPRMVVPFGLGIPNPKNAKPSDSEGDKFWLDFSLDTRDPKTADFKKVIERLDDYNVEYIANHSEEFFGDKFSADDIRKHKKYTSMVKMRFDPNNPKVRLTDYPDKFRSKLRFTKGKPDFQVVNDKMEEIHFSRKVGEDKYEYNFNWAGVPEGKRPGEEGHKRFEAIPIIQCEGFYIIGRLQVHCNWRVKMLRVFSSEDSAIGVNSFRNDDEQQTPTAPVPVQNVVKEPVSETVVEEEEESDDEEGEGEEEED